MNREKKMLLVSFVATLLTFAGMFGFSSFCCADNSTKTEPIVLSQEQMKFMENLSGIFGQVAEHVRPSVVNISSVKKIEVSRHFERLPDFYFDSPFKEFFGEDFFDRFFYPRFPKRGYVQKGLGTGVIVDEDGYILTNNHVIDGADEITIKTYKDKTYKAEVIGTDPKTDLALLKIDANNLVAANLGDSDDIKIGQWVVAVGNPFGLTQTVTAGIVSAKGRSNLGIVDYEDYIQTDAAINPGNSGGPLLDLRGRIIGINAAIYSKSGGYMGIGFAIPVNMAKSVMDSLIDKGRVIRGWLGVNIQDLDEGLSESFGFEGTDGVLIADIVPDGPADKSGLKPGDIIIRYDGKRVKNTSKLKSYVSSTSPGDDVEIEVFRDGREKKIDVEIEELKDDAVTWTGEKPSVDLGMKLKTLTPEMAQQYGYEEKEGILVTEVDPFGLAAAAGIKVNDLILSVQGKAIKNTQQFWDEVKKQDVRKGIRLFIQSGPYRRFVFLKSG